MYIVGTGLESIERVDISLEHVLSLAKPSKPKKDSWTGVPTHRDSPITLSRNWTGVRTRGPILISEGRTEFARNDGTKHSVTQRP